MKVRIILLSIVAWSLFATTVFAADKAYPFVVSGVVSNSGSDHLIRDFADYLGRRSGYPLKPVFVDSYEKLSSTLKNHEGSLGWTCGVPFVEDNYHYGQKIISVPLFQGRPLYDSVVISTAQNKGKSLMDFRDGVLAYSDPRSNSGYVAPAYHLMQRKQEISQYFRLLLHTGNHENSIEAILNGLADVAAVDEYIWVNYRKTNPADAEALVELERFGPFPFTPIVANPSVADKNIARMRKVLAQMHQDPEGQALLKRFVLDGFVTKDSNFYQPLLERMLEMGKL